MAVSTVREILGRGRWSACVEYPVINGVRSENLRHDILPEEIRKRIERYGKEAHRNGLGGVNVTDYCSSDEV